MRLNATLLCVVLLSFTVSTSEAGILDSVENAFEEADETSSRKIAKIQNSVTALYRQVMLQQLFLEERIRSDGDSGVKQVRLQTDGTRNYYSDSHIGIQLGE